MSNEELNKKMEFIVEQQAKFAAEIAITREVQATDAKLMKDAVLTVVGLVGSLTRAQLAADDRLTELTEVQAHTDDRINLLVQTQTRTEERFNQLAQAQTRNDESFNLLAHAQTRTEEGIKLLMESQARTDERLNIFINVVERHISGNGGAENRA
jgi:hypothetical protein